MYVVLCVADEHVVKNGEMERKRGGENGSEYYPVEGGERKRGERRGEERGRGGERERERGRWERWCGLRLHNHTHVQKLHC